MSGKPSKIKRMNQLRVERGLQLLALRADGYTVLALAEAKFMINGRLVLDVAEERWHDAQTKEDGSFKGRNLTRLVMEFFPPLRRNA